MAISRDSRHSGNHDGSAAIDAAARIFPNISGPTEPVNVSTVAEQITFLGVLRINRPAEWEIRSGCESFAER